MTIEIKDISQIEKIISICDKYISLYDRDSLDQCLYCETSFSDALPSFLGDKFFEIINKRALEELLPYLTGYEQLLDGYYEIISTNNYSDFVEKTQLVKKGEKPIYCQGSILEYGDDMSYFDGASNPCGITLSNYCPTFFNEDLTAAYRDMYLGEGVVIHDMDERELFKNYFPYACNLDIIPDTLIEQFYNDCMYSEESVTYLVRSSKCIPAFEHWDNMFDATKDPTYRLLVREAIKDLKCQDYVYHYIGMDDICYCYEDKDTYYDVRRIYSDTYSNVLVDDRYLYPDVFYKNLKLEVLIIYLNKKYHFYDGI